MHLLTVTRRYREPGLRHPEGQWVPLLRMSGRWLEQCGFANGARIYVIAQQRKLMLTNYDPASADVQDAVAADRRRKRRRAAAPSRLDRLRLSLRRVALRRRSIARAGAVAPLPQAAVESGTHCQ